MATKTGIVGKSLRFAKLKKKKKKKKIRHRRKKECGVLFWSPAASQFVC